MKKLFFAFMLVGTFATIAEVDSLNENLAISNIDLEVDKALDKAEDEWACCTVTRNGGSATVCRADGNTRRACRQARRYTREM